ncbi:hypothetical protein PG985_008263 [Apiospora marii]|uniref:uncharacterized protein n=1 Tax=Apiospora marii TaxID=335849 RepID=UPI0031315857
MIQANVNVGNPGPAPKRITRRRGACTQCKQKKIRCDGGKPCSACARANTNPCQYELRYGFWSDTHQTSSPGGPPVNPDHSAPTIGSVVDPGILASQPNAQRNNNEWATLTFDLGPNYFSELGHLLPILQDEDDHTAVMDTISAALEPCEMSISPVEFDGVDVRMDDLCHTMDMSKSPPMPNRDQLSWAASSQSGTTKQTINSESSRSACAPLHIPDHVALDCSLAKSFGLADFPGLDTRSDSISRSLRQVLRRLAAHSLCGSDPIEHMSTSPPPSPLEHPEDDALIKRSIDAFWRPVACFDYVPECQLFLRKPDVAKLLAKAARQTAPSSSLLSTLPNIVVMVGYGAIEEEAAKRSPGSSIKGSGEYLYPKAIVDSYTVLYSAKSGLLKLQVSRPGLQLRPPAAVRNPLDRVQLLPRPAIDEPGVRREGLPARRRPADGQAQRLVSLLPRDAPLGVSRHTPLFQPEHLGILHPEPGQWEDAGDPLAHQLAAATWLGTTFRRVYGPHAQHQTTPERLAETRAREGALAAWRAALPDDIRQVLGGGRRLSPRLGGRGDQSSMPMRLRVFCGYHENVYLLFGPWIRPAVLAEFQNGGGGGSPAGSGSGSGSGSRLSSSLPFSSSTSPSPPPASSSLSSSTSDTQETESARHGGGVADLEPIYALGRCLESACAIIASAHEMLSLDRSLARRLYDLMTVSLCVVVYAIKFGHPSVRRQVTVHLGICCGVFCSLHTVDHALPFDEVLHVVKLIHSDR